MGEVIVLHVDTKLPIPVDRVLDGAKDAIPDTCMVIGWDHEDELYLAASIADKHHLLWLLEKAKAELLNMA